MDTKATDELYNAIIKKEGINFRGISIGDSLESVREKEGKNLEERGGSLPNFKYFFEIGETEELIVVYAYPKETKIVKTLELTLKTYPKYYWKKAGGTDIMDFYNHTKNNTLQNFIPHFIACKNKIIAHFDQQLGAAEIDTKDFVYNKPHQNFSKHTWVSEKSRLVLMSFLDDEEEPRGTTTMELVLILTAL